MAISLRNQAQACPVGSKRRHCSVMSQATPKGHSTLPSSSTPTCCAPPPIPNTRGLAFRLSVSYCRGLHCCHLPLLLSQPSLLSSRALARGSVTGFPAPAPWSPPPPRCLLHEKHRRVHWVCPARQVLDETSADPHHTAGLLVSSCSSRGQKARSDRSGTEPATTPQENAVENLSTLPTMPSEMNHAGVHMPSFSSDYRMV